MALKQWEKQEQTRLRGVAMLKAGFSPTHIARELGVARQTVYRWKERGGGKRATIRAAGRKAELRPGQSRHLARILERGAVAYGFASEMWTGRRIAFVIRERFGIDYHFKSIPYLLKSLGWSWQKPSGRALERDEQGIAKWVSEDWPRIKKSPAPGGGHHFRR